uniref:Secreted protein n=1 Tax=Oryza punctata TaxID=4537 RepID=A0A0E0LSL8_ORYPU
MFSTALLYLLPAAAAGHHCDSSLPLSAIIIDFLYSNYIMLAVTNPRLATRIVVIAMDRSSPPTMRRHHHLPGHRPSCLLYSPRRSPSRSLSIRITFQRFVVNGEVNLSFVDIYHACVKEK